MNVAKTSATEDRSQDRTSGNRTTNSGTIPDRVREIADAVLYEGYLLYPYRADSRKNQSRWQFGVLGPPSAAESGIGEEDTISGEMLLQGDRPQVTVTVRFLQLQRRRAERDCGSGIFEPVDELRDGRQTWLTWDEAVECEVGFGPFTTAELGVERTLPITVPGAREVEAVVGGRLVRTRRDLHAELTLVTDRIDDLTRLRFTVGNVGTPAADKDEAIAVSLIGTHLIAAASDGQFVSLLEPPADAVAAVAACTQHRCFPVLVGPAATRDLMLASPIILYDHPEIAEQSRGALYDSTEIDEILTLRVMTMTDEEKAAARATDPLAARIVDRCDTMSAEELLNLHGVLRNPHGDSGLVPAIPDGVDWWDPEADLAVQPSADAVLVNGIRVSRGSRVVLHPSRRADAQDIFFAGKTARVTSVHSDVDGNQHVAVVVDDDPAADLHDWYGRYLYFAPDEVEPLTEGSPQWKQ